MFKFIQFNLSLRVGQLSESKADKVQLKAVDGEALRLLVKYAYSGQITVTEDNVQV